MVVVAIYWGREPDPEPQCHGCDLALTADNTSVNADTCEDCLTHCGCWVCSETRWQIGEDRAEQASFDAMREAS